jgi:hypothetical protein
MRRKPAGPLPADPKRARAVRYPGLYVTVWDDGSWEWVKCVNCGKPLTTLESRQRGSGPSCAAVVTPAAKEAILSAERVNAAAYLDEKRNPTPQYRRAAKQRPVDTSGPDTVRLPPGSRSQMQPCRKKARGITNPQAKLLGRLQREVGETYTGNGMTEAEARREINRLRTREG